MQVTAHARIGMARDMIAIMKLGGWLNYTGKYITMKRSFCGLSRFAQLPTRRAPPSHTRFQFSDTDSIIFSIPNNPELIKKMEQKFNFGSKAYNAYKYETKSSIKSFVSLGAKNYSYVTNDATPICVVKSRGFSLNSIAAKETITHEKMSSMLRDHLHDQYAEAKCRNFTMKINRKKATVFNSSTEKTYANDVYDNRIVMTEHFQRVTGLTDNSGGTLPFGLKHYNFADCDREAVFQ